MVKVITYGTYDLFHQGHLEHLTEAFSKCEILVVGINDDELVEVTPENIRLRKRYLTEQERNQQNRLKAK